VCSHQNPPLEGLFFCIPLKKIIVTKASIYIITSIANSLNPEKEKETDLLELVDKGYHLIVWNDEVNTFEWVIETLIDVCGHERIQAEQCAWLIHTRGKYAVKDGDYETLKSMCDAITERGIGATVESAA
jgi:ATP-dependent Clp protease adaptor protein ClpS